jgi:small-conductance mechanosensitive channel
MTLSEVVAMLRTSSEYDSAIPSPWAQAADAVADAQSKLSTLEVERSMDQKLIEAEQGRIKELSSRLDACVKRLDVRFDDDGGGHDEIDRLTAALQNSELDVEISEDKLEALRKSNDDWFLMHQDDIEKMEQLVGERDAALLRLDESEKKREQLRNDVVDLCGRAQRESAAEFMRQRDEALLRLDACRRLVNEQAENEGLWFVATTAPEAYLQQELRKLHAAIESDPSAPSEGEKL